MKTVIISFYETYPPESGAATVSYNTTKYLPGKKWLIQLSHHKKKYGTPFVFDFQLQIINIHTASKNRIWKFFKIFSHYASILKQLRIIKPDIIFLEGASWTFYCYILTKMLPFLNLDAFLVYHAHNVEYLLRKEKNIQPVVRLTKFSERRLMRNTDISTAVSRQDADWFHQLYGAKTYLFPNGVDIHSFDRIKDSDIEKIKQKYHLKGKIVLFMGLAGYKPTEEALDFLIKQVFPKILTQEKKAKFAVLGGNINRNESFIINPGMIPFKEVPVFIKACDVCTAPIFSGSGTRLKILEYLAAGKAAVSTTKGAEGLDVAQQKNIILADDAAQFAAAILDLLKNPDKADAIGKAGKKLVRENYSWEKIIDDFMKQTAADFPKFFCHGDPD